MLRPGVPQWTPLAVVLVLVAPAHAASLAGRLGGFVQDNTSIFTVGGVADFVTPAIERLAIRGIDFPHTSTAPGFTYRFDFESTTYVREPRAIGPVFAERPETVGRHVLDVGVSFLWADLDQVDGGSFGVASTGRFPYTDPMRGPLDFGTALDLDRFSLRTAAFDFSATYGLTDRWDVNVLVPLLDTHLSVGAVRRGAVFDAAGNLLAYDAARVGLDADAVGVGDLLLRTKYSLVDAPAGRVAVALTVRAPTGREEDFQGLGDWTVTPALVAAREVGRTHLHGNLGFELNGADPERDRVRYAVGATVRIWDRLGAFADVLGSSGTADDHFTLRSLFPALLPPSTGIGIDGTRRTAAGTTTAAFVPRSDVVDLATGLKMEMRGRLVWFAGVIVPLTSDGLRADVVPTAGAQLAF